MSKFKVVVRWANPAKAVSQFCHEAVPHDFNREDLDPE
jgi:hypothetical protein